MEIKNLPNSHKLLYSEIKERLKDQFESIDSLDTKAGITLGFVGAILAGLINANWFLNLPFYFLFFILLMLVTTIILLLKVIFVQTYRKDPEPKNLIGGYKDKSEDETLKQLIRNFEYCFTNNQGSINNKKKYLNWSFLLLAGTIVFVCLIVLVSTQLNMVNLDNRFHLKRQEVNKYGRFRR